MSFSIYPNPVSDELIIQTNSTKPALSLSNVSFRVEIYDAIGRVGFVSTLSNSTSVLDLSQFENGFYILKLYIGNEVLHRSFIKQ